jgi:Xaa-Pro aminopeptidase
MRDIRQLMVEKGIESIFIGEKQNVRYLSGYGSDDAFLLLTRKEFYFLTDPRYTEEATETCKDFQIINWREQDSVGAALMAILRSEGLDTLHFEENNIGYSLYRQLSEFGTVALAPVTGLIETLRSVKEDKEIACSRAACAIADRAFERILNEIQVGVTERELSGKLAYFLKSEGSDARCYENIVLSGSRTSLLHGIPSDKAVQQGDLVLMDFGAGYGGYLSDMSRTVIVGKASDMQREIYGIIKQSEEDMMASIRDGVSTRETYTASLKAMADSEYLEFHYTGVGHGVGLAVHEKPFIGPSSRDVFVTGNIVTLEPGIYIPKWGGIRIEDQVLVTAKGCDKLTQANRQLIELV